MVSFQGQSNPQKYKNPNKIILFKGFLMRFFVNYIYILSKLIIYIFTFWYSLASTVFPKAKYSVLCTESPMGSNFYFPQW